ncbi:hypothetical protein BC835DRAFT_863550 [Cytidiella melzeri]|nr:hypothetical protein BC835DRAFT_863550 [Cytidiella melzeri]
MNKPDGPGKSKEGRSSSLSVTRLPMDVWLHICLELSVKSLYMLRATCKGLRHVVDERSVWLTVLLDLKYVKPSVYTREDIAQMSATRLREASLLMVRVDQAFSSPKLPHGGVPVLPAVDLSDVTQLALIPGGERLVILRTNGTFDIYDVATGNVVGTAPRMPVDGLPANRSFLRLYPISLHTGYIVTCVSVVSHACVCCKSTSQEHLQWRNSYKSERSTL